MTTPKKGKALAKPYEPTPQEAAAVARHDRRQAVSPGSFRLKCAVGEPNENGVRVASFSIDHPDANTGEKLVSDAIGSADWAFVAGLLKDATGIAVTADGNADLERANYALSIVKGLQPRDQVEALLGVQMAAIQVATMRTAAYLANSKKVDNTERYERSLNRLTRTFAAQVEALKRYRSKGEQRVIVERVTVENGGQAIVGAVGTGVGVDDKRAG